jgi:dTDP-4-amino-4,6-dideoxygalactose transaminase
MLVPFLDLKRETEQYRADIERAVGRVIHSGRYILGPELEALEKEFAIYLKVPFAAGVGSGTDALALALEATERIQPGKGDEVITTAFSAAFTALAICEAGAVPRFVDIDPLTLQIDPRLIESAIGESTRAILPVHLFGHASDMNRIGELAREHHLEVVEDACQAHGSRWEGEWLGSLSRAAAFSFYPTKNLGALGDAGMVVTHDADLWTRVRKLRHGGQGKTYEHELLGCNSRLDEIQAAVLRCKLERLEARNAVRREWAARYDEAFAGLNLALLPVERALLPNRHLYPVRSSSRDELRRHLRENGIETLVHYPTPLPSQPALKRFVLPGQQFPIAEKAAREIFSLPLYPELTEQELQYTIETVRRFFRC